MNDTDQLLSKLNREIMWIKLLLNRTDGAIYEYWRGRLLTLEATKDQLESNKNFPPSR